MTPIKVPGNKELLVVCLLPTGSANEKTKGISHFFEHIFITKLLHNFTFSKISGHTTEDYVMLFCYQITPRKILETLQRMTFEKREVENHKRTLIEEIEMEAFKEEETFFRFVWQETGTGYEKSPLGTIEEVGTVTVDMLGEVREEILKGQLFFYSSPFGLDIINRFEDVKVTGINAWWRNKTYQRKGNNRCYEICYFSNRIEVLYLMVRILKALNPGKHIQLSEKKRMSALIVESGVQFPTLRNIGPLREKALGELERDLAGIKTNINERALNELESVYFYGKRWQERIALLFQTTDRQLLDMGMVGEKRGKS